MKKKILIGIAAGGLFVFLIIGGRFIFPEFSTVIQKTIATIEEEVKKAEPSEIPFLIETENCFKEALKLWEKEKIKAERRKLRNEILMVRSYLLDYFRLKRQFMEAQELFKEAFKTSRRLRENIEKLIEKIMEGKG